MPLYEYECINCSHIETYLSKSVDEGRMVAYMNCSECGGLCRKIVSGANFRVTGFNAKNGYNLPKESDVLDADGYAKKRWSKK